MPVLQKNERKIHMYECIGQQKNKFYNPAKVGLTAENKDVRIAPNLAAIGVRTQKNGGVLL